MSHHINLSTFGSELSDAYNKVVSSSSNVNWALFGYDKNTNDLRVSGTGEGGLEELQDEFEDSKVQYAFTKVTDTSTGLQKFVFINWSGDGVPVSKKALIASHSSDVKARFKGFHVEITARSNTDVNPAVIMKKVQDSSGAKYSHQQTGLHVRKDMPDDKKAPKTTEDQVAKLRADREARDKELFARERQVQKQPVEEASATSADQLRKEREQRDKELVAREKAAHKERQANVAPSAKLGSAEDLRKERAQQDKELMEREKASQKAREEQSSNVSSAPVVASVPDTVRAQSQNARNVWAQREKSSSENLSAKAGGSQEYLSKVSSSKEDLRVKEQAAASERMRKEQKELAQRQRLEDERRREQEEHHRQLKEQQRHREEDERMLAESRREEERRQEQLRLEEERAQQAAQKISFHRSRGLSETNQSHTVATCA